MNVVSQTIQLLLAPPGGLVYHLLILFALEAVLGMALGAWRRRRAGEPEQVSGIFVAAVSGMLLVRLILIAVALVGLSGAYSADNLIPPLDRALNTAATALLVWALLPWGRSRDLSWLFLSLGLVGTVLALALFLPAWQSDLAANPSLIYNGSWQEAIWILAQLALLGLGVLGLLWRRDREWALLLSVLLLLVTGHVLQLLSPDREVHMAGWERLAQLIAFPLLATAVYRRVLGNLSWRAHELEEASQDSLSRIAGLIDLLESGQRTSTSLDMAEVLARAVREVVRLLRVDICGLIFPIDGARSRASLAAVYDRQSRGTANVVTFGLAEHPALEHAIKRKKQVVIDTTVNHAQVRGLYVLMGSVEVGPLLIQPLLHNSVAIGALLVGNPSSTRRFTSSQQKLCQALSRQVTAAIENARRYQVSQSELGTLKTQLQERKEGHQRIIAALQAQLQQAKEDATLFARRLDETTTHVKRERENAESLAKQLQKSEEERTYLE
ncbi:MAG: GAF domain-containing protein, partial [Anaerolineae bacterium]